jgi:catechol 2,3-dioxygenase-like lactoylglutathione lyase family enzyme
MQPSRIHHVGLPVSDLDLSVAGYREALGLTHESNAVDGRVFLAKSRAFQLCSFGNSPASAPLVASLLPSRTPVNFLSGTGSAPDPRRRRLSVVKALAGPILRGLSPGESRAKLIG